MLTARIPVAASDRKGATDANCTRIAAIDAYESLGYRGCGREEHSGENAPVWPEEMAGELADNWVWQTRGVA
jgi:hypothetical protein